MLNNRDVAEENVLTLIEIDETLCRSALIRTKRVFTLQNLRLGDFCVPRGSYQYLDKNRNKEDLRIQRFRSQSRSPDYKSPINRRP